ncbi:MAG TPA: adenylate/guanylate cyclase domain-containing protein [Verrucomicrobiota bacterium]|nr:adenylate/guanylate cyclase domain-containing protein [Verrucomicrobiota bacterium]
MPPSGESVTFLFTDIERSSILWEMHPQAMGRALAQHDAMMRAVFAEHRGYVFKTMGDAFCVAFGNAGDAVVAAVEAQRRLTAAVWEETGPLRVRMALHTGGAEQRDGDYFGPTLNRVARVLSAGHGGQTLLSSATADRVRLEISPDMTLRDLGERRLKDLSRPERIFQVVVRDLPAEFPPLRSLEVLPNNLPAQVTSFVGRAREMAEVKRMLGTSRLVTLTGPGGTGKTRLSLQVAAEVLENFPHGVWLAELATVTDPELVPEAVAEALDIRTEAGRTASTTLLDALRARHLLLVLDNCEHLIAACASLAAALLSRCPEVRILASSREPLNIAGESLWLVPALPSAEFSDTPQHPEFSELAQLESVQLFVDRAAAVRPGFVLTPENAGVIAEICWRLDGIPLAIELAAARIKLLPLNQILERLDDRFRFLTGGNRAALPRQQTLGALIEWSHDLLTEPERTLLRRLVVFVGGRTLEMVEDVCSGEGIERHQVFDLLSSLTDKSLLMVERGPNDDPRYTLLESIWTFAEEKLEKHGETVRFRQRHLEYFVRFAENAEPELFRGQQKEWLDRLGTEHHNLNHALRFSLENPETLELGLRLAGALIRYWEVRNYFTEGYEHCLNLLQAAKPEDTFVRARATLGAGRLAWCQDRDEDARRHYQEAQRIYRSLGRTAEVAFSETYLGFIERNEGNAEKALAHFDAALTIGHSLGSSGLLNSERLRAMVANGQGSLAADAGDSVRALQKKEEALIAFQALADLWVVGLLHGSLGRVCLALGDVSAARRHLVQALSIARELGNKWAIHYVLEAIGDLAALEGHPEKAVRLYGAASAQREALAQSFSRIEQVAYDRALAGLRERVAEENFAAEWQAGEALTLAAATRLALE